MSVLGGVDALTEISRNFYENTRTKIVLSLMFGCYSLFLLSWCCQAGGYATYYDQYMDSNLFSAVNDDTLIASVQANATGNGFACFFYLIAFILSAMAALYISPLVSG